MRTPHSFIRPTTLLLTAISLLAVGCDKVQTSPPPTMSTRTHSPTSSTAQVDPTLHPTKTLTIGTHTFSVEIAKTETEQAQGLSGIQSIQNTEGMIFLFDPPSRPTFWMKDMLFPIDILWIQNNKVVGINEHLTPPSAGRSNTQLPLYLPPTNVDMVLEINAGLTELYNIHIGDTLGIDYATQ